MSELRRRQVPLALWSTDQHVSGVHETLTNLGLPQPDRHLVPASRRKHIAASLQVPGWVLSIAGEVLRHRRTLGSDLDARGTARVLVVHGDTFTTVIGALIGRLLHARVAHVEAGMRSGSLRHPFPEELNRRVVARLATLHYAPTEREVSNLRREKARGEIRSTGANTAVDALRAMLEAAPDEPGLPEHFGLVTLHRFELVRNAPEFEAILRTLSASATAEVPLIMVGGQAERERIAELKLQSLFGDHFRLMEKRPYAQFLPLVRAADFVVTDSGGLQQECAALGKPCAVHRERTETHQGLGENVVLTGLDQDAVSRFIASWEQYVRPSALDRFHPSRIVADSLERAAHPGR